MQIGRFFVALGLVFASGCTAPDLFFQAKCDPHPFTPTPECPGESPAGGAACVPTIEICGNGIDEDCSGEDCSATTPAWSKRFGDAARQVVSKVALASDGSIRVVGEFDGTIDLGAGAALLDTMDKAPQPYILKLNADGTPAWGRHVGDFIGGSITDAIVVPDGSNHTLTTGYFAEVGADSELLVLRWDGDGNPVPGWNAKLITPDQFGCDAVGSHVSLSPDGATLYVTGAVSGGGTLNCKTPTSFKTPASDEYFQLVAAFDMATGACTWARVFEASSYYYRHVPIGVAPSGSLVVVPSYSGPGLAGAMLPDTIGNLNRTYVLRLDPANGEILHAVGFVEYGFDNPHIEALVIADGNLYLGGDFDHTVAIAGQPPIVGRPDTNGFVMALDPETFAMRWGDALTGSQWPKVTSIAAFAGDILVGGFAGGPVVADASSNVENLCADGSAFCLFLARMRGTDGTRLWFRDFPSTGKLMGLDTKVASGPEGFALGAYLNGPMDFGNGMLESYGDTDILVAKFPALP